MCPGVRLVVGRWGCESETAEPAEGVKGAEGTDRSPAETRKRLAELHAVLVTEGKQTPGGKRALVGTAGA
jgi:hypothetical protein